MSPELIQAIKERITAEHTKEDIRQAVLAMGHTATVFEAAYTLAINDLEKGGASTLRERSTPTLPKATDLVKQAFSYVCSRLDLVLAVFLPSGLLLILTEYSDSWSLGVYGPVLVALLTIVVLIGYMLVLAGVIFIVSTTERKTLKEGMRWALRHLVPLAAVYFLTAMIIWGGLLFFVIPGLVALITLYFSQYAFVIDNKRGMDALLHSRGLVTGRFFTVLKKLGALWILLIVPVMLISMVAAILSDIVAELLLPSIEVAANVVIDLVIEAATALVVIMCIHAMLHLYRALSHEHSVNEPSSRARMWYWFLALFGFTVAMFLAVWVIVFETGDKTKLPQWLQVEESAFVKQAVATTGFAARQYAATNNNSYEGVCTRLVAEVTGAQEVVCNDSAEDWAVFARSGDEWWCADRTTYTKKTKAPEGDQRFCIDP